MKLTPRYFILTGVAIAAMVGAMLYPRPSPRAGGAMPQQAYIWQRAWTPAVRDATVNSARDFSSYTVLAAEVSFTESHPRVARVALDYGSLKPAGIPVGIALRIGPIRGPIAEDDQPARRLAELAASLVCDAQTAGVRPAELQIDFDAAASKLDAYRVWVQAIRRRVAPVPVTITALPSWLHHSAFSALARASDGYVLQVHSLKRPTSIDAPMTLCDAAAARRAVEQAGRIGVPFRVALPTYGYLVAFDDAGKFVGLCAEGPAATWPAGTRVRALRAEPAAMSQLVRGWQADRPACMRGIIWYRLPVGGDAMNWRIQTLRTVMQGRAPRPLVAAHLRKPEPRLVEVELVNEGDADAPLDSRVVLRWSGASLVAADALGGFEQASNENEVTIRPSAASNDRLAPGDRRTIAWVRTSDDTEVLAHVSEINP